MIAKPRRARKVIEYTGKSYVGQDYVTAPRWAESTDREADWEPVVPERDWQTDPWAPWRRFAAAVLLKAHKDRARTFLADEARTEPWLVLLGREEAPKVRR